MPNYTDSTPVKYINAQIRALQEAGIPIDERFLGSQIVEMIRKGDARINLDVAERICAAVHIEPKLLVGLVLEEHWPDLHGPLSRSGLIRKELQIAGRNERSFVENPAELEGLPGGLQPPDSGLANANEGYLSFVDLNFKVTPGFHMKFKLEATKRRLSMKQLIEKAFEFYVSRHPIVE